MHIEEEIIECKGILIVGDPHVSDKAPNRRIDDYLNAILGKIEFIVNLANEKELLVVMTGDLFDNHKVDNNIMSRLARILRKCWTTPLTNVGNHDMPLGASVLSEGDSLYVLDATGVIKAFKHQSIQRVLIDGYKFDIGFSPYGTQIPQKVDNSESNVIWITHHDVAFPESNYPGGLQPFEIEGCVVVINGHMHKYLKEVQVGETTWYNFGNINRQSIDCADHIPTVWELNPNGFIPHEIPHVKNVFDMVGHIVDTESGLEKIRDKSIFADLLNNDEIEEKGEDEILKIIKKKFEERKTPVPVQNLVLNLWQETVENFSDKNM